MKLPSFDRLNYCMHVVAFAEFCIFGLGAPIALLPAPGEEQLSDPVFFPGDTSSAAPIWVRITVVLIVALIVLIPALWILTLHLATVKKGGKVIGWCVLGFALLVSIEGLSVSYGDPSKNMPREWTLGYFASFGLALAVGGYLILYSKWIYGLSLKVPGPELAASAVEGDQETGPRFSPETRQLLGRLAMFTVVVFFALLVTGVLSVFPQFKDQPHYLTIGFFGILGSGMVVTGLLREDTLARILPWSKPEKT